jgi:diacylglycerol kinase (ATP)
MKLSIIANPVAGRGRAYKSIRRYLDQWRNPDWEVDLLTTRSRDHAGQLALELLSNPPDLLFICGGDGTINEVASQVPNPPFPVAIVPAGTANVVARELQLPLDPVRALQIGLQRTWRNIDLGILGPGLRRRFLFVAGIGFDAYVVSQVDEKLKSRVGIAAYAIAIVRCLRSYAFPEFQVVAEGRTYTATSCLAANGRRYGGGLLFCPGADMCDGSFDIVVLQGKRRIALAWFLLKARLQLPGKSDWIHRFRTSALKIEGPPDVWVQADGELVGGLPLEIALTPSVFPLVFPKHCDNKSPFANRQ